jgi:circadian clock protein KaiC
MTHELHNSFNITEFTKHGISFVADNLILLETKAEGLDIRRYIRIVKMRSSAHELRLREFVISGGGIRFEGDTPEDKTGFVL